MRALPCTMAGKCPGQKSNRELDSVMVPCPNCCRLVEFFTDEARLPCRCGKVLFREARPSCADWCPAAAQCLGLDIETRTSGKPVAQSEEAKHAEAYVTGIGEKVRDKASDTDSD